MCAYEYVSFLNVCAYTHTLAHTNHALCAYTHTRIYTCTHTRTIPKSVRPDSLSLFLSATFILTTTISRFHPAYFLGFLRSGRLCA
jgi:hypothetical protein